MKQEQESPYLSKTAVNVAQTVVIRQLVQALRINVHYKEPEHLALLKLVVDHKLGLPLWAQGINDLLCPAVLDPFVCAGATFRNQEYAGWITFGCEVPVREVGAADRQLNLAGGSRGTTGLKGSKIHI